MGCSKSLVFSATALVSNMLCRQIGQLRAYNTHTHTHTHTHADKHVEYNTTNSQL